jgi:hypothetical protein
VSVKELYQVIFLLIAIGAWIGFAEHPTAQNLRKAIRDTLAAE